MKIMGGWYIRFEFTPEQKAQLTEILQCDNEDVHQLLSTIELIVPSYNVEVDVVVKQGLETPRQARTILSRIARNAKQLYNDLDSLDTLGSASESAFSRGIEDLGANLDFMDPFMKELILVAGAAGGSVKLIEPAQRGRRPSNNELMFIATVGRFYRQHLNLQTKPSRGTQFTRFMQKVFEIVDPGNPRSHSDISKFTKKAFAKFQPDNGIQ